MTHIGTMNKLLNQVAHICLILSLPSLYLSSSYADTLDGTYVVPQRFFGMHIHGAENKKNWPAISFDSWRLWDAGVSWPNLQPTANRWDFKKLDSFISHARRSDIEVLLPLGLSPTWASARPNEPSAYKKPGWASEPKKMKDWESYVRRVARRYKGQIAAYEIWNEPNLKHFFSGTIDTMLDLSCRASVIIHQEDPAALVVSPAATDRLNGVHWLNDYLRKGGARCIDVVGFHFYVYAHEPPEAIDTYIKKVRKTMKDNGIERMPLWNTETGWYFANSDGGPKIKYHVTGMRESAAYVMRAYIIAASEGLHRFYWYAWNNALMGGLIEPVNGRLKPAAHAYSVVRQWLRGASIGRCRSPGGIWNCPVILADGRRGQFAWVPNDHRKISVKDGARIERFQPDTGHIVASDIHAETVTVDKFPMFIQFY